jgi:hypothetical protein
MAIFKVQRSVFQQPGIIEAPGKIFIEGQAHDATTLSPIFNQGWPSSTASFTRANNALPLYSMSNRMWQISPWGVNPQVSAGAFDMTLMDAGQGRINYAYQMVNSPNTLIVGPDTQYYSEFITAKFYNLNTLQFMGNTNTGSLINPYDRGIGGIFFERDANNVYAIWQGNHPYWGRNDAFTYRVFNINPSTRAVTQIAAEPTTSGLLSMVLIHESSTQFYFYAARSDGTVNTAKTHQIYTLDKATTTWTQRGSNTRPATTGGPMYFPSHAINTTGTAHAAFMGEYGAATGSKITFAVMQFDANTPASAPTWTNVTPSGAALSPGSLSQSNQLSLRTWAFTSGSNTYICVAPFDNAIDTTVPALTDYYIHVYKCATASPTTISYVASTQVNSSLRPKALIPTSSNFSNLVVPFRGSISFFYWNAATERYVLGSSLAVDPNFVSVDQTGRTWIAESNTALNANLHVVSPTISSTITVNFQSTSITYAGTVVNTNLLVSAYNFSGSRTANSVTLQMDTNSATFADGTTSKLVTTLTSGDLSVPIKITGAGYVRVLANLSI